MNGSNEAAHFWVVTVNHARFTLKRVDRKMELGEAWAALEETKEYADVHINNINRGLPYFSLVEWAPATLDLRNSGMGLTDLLALNSGLVSILRVTKVGQVSTAGAR